MANDKIVEFPGLQALADKAATIKTVGPAHPRAFLGNKNHGWTLGASFDDALGLIRKGWPEGTARVTKLAKKLVDKVAPKVQNTALEYRDDGGPLIDVARYCEGEPEHYLEFAPEVAREPITINANIAMSAFVSGETCVRRGAVILAVAEILQARGFVVTINAFSNVKDNTGADYTIKWGVASPGENIDADTLAFALCHPAMLRRMAFAIREVDEERSSRFRGGDVGKPREPRNLPSGKLYQGALISDTDLGSDTQAEFRVLELLKQAGCDFAEEV